MDDRFRLRLFPVVLAFLAFLAGVLAAGVWGGPLMIFLAVILFGVASIIVRTRAGRPPSWAWPLAILFMLGAARHEADGIRALPPWPLSVLREASGPNGRLSIEVTVERLLRRDRVGTGAEVHVRAVFEDGRRSQAPPGLRATLKGPGLLPVVRGGTYVVRARLITPRPQPDHLGPRWPSPVGRVVLAVSNASDIVPLVGPDLPSPSRLDRARFQWASRILAALDGDAGDFACAILLGEGRGVDPGLRLALSRLGTAHILAVSGLHVAITAALAGLVLVRVFGPFLARFVPSINLVFLGLMVATVGAVGVALLAGGTPSAVRAALMCGLATASRVLDRGPRLESCVALAGLLDLVVAPKDAFSLSFLLSYAAVLGIAAMHRPLAKAWTPMGWEASKRKQFVIQALAVSVAASLATTPLSLLAFGTFGVVAPMANLVVVPVLAFVVMPLALVLLAVAAMCPAWLEPVALASGTVFRAFLDAQRITSSLVPSGWDGFFGPFVLPASCGALFAVLAWSLGARRRVLLACGMLAFALALAWMAPRFPPSDALTVTFLDVGKGDAILVDCPTGRRYLVDTGEARAFPRLLRALASRGISSLDGVVLTHGDEDHVGGMPALSRSFALRSVFAPCQEARRQPLAAMLSSLSGDGVAIACLGQGQDALPGCGITSTVLWPPVLEPVSGNAASLVLRLEWSGRSVLLTGDLDAIQEERLVSRWSIPLSADVVKLGHHGSAGSSSTPFLEAVRPVLAIVSGHASRIRRMAPAPVLDRVGKIGAVLRSTDEEGDIAVTLKNDGILVKSQRGFSRSFSPR